MVYVALHKLTLFIFIKAALDDDDAEDDESFWEFTGEMKEFSSMI